MVGELEMAKDELKACKKAMARGVVTMMPSPRVDASEPK